MDILKIQQKAVCVHNVYMCTLFYLRPLRQLLW